MNFASPSNCCFTAGVKLIELFKKGLLLLSSGQKTMRVMPPLTIGEEEVQKALVIMNEVLS